MIEGDPHRVLEGMLIAAYAIGASRGYIYIRAEYPLAVKALHEAIAQAQAHGFVGKNILGSGLDFEFVVKEGAGAFVCGEETALMHSIEGYRGMPTMRPPYPSEHGLWGHPDQHQQRGDLRQRPHHPAQRAGLVCRHGHRAQRRHQGLCAGRRRPNAGLVEIPIGLTLREMIYDIGGGCRDGRAFKAVQLGGPSGGCIPAELLDTRIDYEDLRATGAIMGSGGMIVVDETTCMVDIARYFLTFTQDESCGKCVPCRVGTGKLLKMLTAITQGRGTHGGSGPARRVCATRCTRRRSAGWARPPPTRC